MPADRRGMETFVLAGGASLALAGLAIGGAAAADDARALAFGRHLSQQCTTCHRIDGTNNGIPSIIGWDTVQFIGVLTSYKNNVRTNEVMVSLAQTLGEPEMQALAAYFGSLKAPAPKAPAKKR